VYHLGWKDNVVHFSVKKAFTFFTYLLQEEL